MLSIVYRWSLIRRTLPLSPHSLVLCHLHRCYHQDSGNTGEPISQEHRRQTIVDPTHASTHASDECEVDGRRSSSPPTALERMRELDRQSSSIDTSTGKISNESSNTNQSNTDTILAINAAELASLNISKQRKPNVEHTIRLIQQLKSQGIRPSSKIFNNLLQSYLSLVRLNRRLQKDFLRHAKPGETIQSLGLLSALEYFQLMHGVLNEMSTGGAEGQAFSVKPDAHTYLILVEAHRLAMMGADQAIDPADAGESSSDLSAHLPSLLALYEDMLQSLPAPTTWLLDAVLLSIARIELKPSLSLHLYAIMLQNGEINAEGEPNSTVLWPGVVPSTRTFTLIITLLARGGLTTIEPCLNSYRLMMKLLRSRPNMQKPPGKLYKSLLNMLVFPENSEAYLPFVSTLFVDMVALEVPISLTHMHQLMVSQIRQKQPTNVMNIIKHLEDNYPLLLQLAKVEQPGSTEARFREEAMEYFVRANMFDEVKFVFDFLRPKFPHSYKVDMWDSAIGQYVSVHQDYWYWQFELYLRWLYVSPSIPMFSLILDLLPKTSTGVIRLGFAQWVRIPWIFTRRDTKMFQPQGPWPADSVRLGTKALKLDYWQTGRDPDWMEQKSMLRGFNFNGCVQMFLQLVRDKRIDVMMAIHTLKKLTSYYITGNTSEGTRSELLKWRLSKELEDLTERLDADAAPPRPVIPTTPPQIVHPPPSRPVSSIPVVDTVVAETLGTIDGKPPEASHVQSKSTPRPPAGLSSVPKPIRSSKNVKPVRAPNLTPEEDEAADRLFDSISSSSPPAVPPSTEVKSSSPPPTALSVDTTFFDVLPFIPVATADEIVVPVSVESIPNTHAVTEVKTVQTKERTNTTGKIIGANGEETPTATKGGMAKCISTDVPTAASAKSFVPQSASSSSLPTRKTDSDPKLSSLPAKLPKSNVAPNVHTTIAPVVDAKSTESTPVQSNSTPRPPAVSSSVRKPFPASKKASPVAVPRLTSEEDEAAGRLFDSISNSNPPAVPPSTEGKSSSTPSTAHPTDTPFFDVIPFIPVATAAEVVVPVSIESIANTHDVTEVKTAQAKERTHPTVKIIRTNGEATPTAHQSDMTKRSSTPTAASTKKLESIASSPSLPTSKVSSDPKWSTIISKLPKASLVTEEKGEETVEKLAPSRHVPEVLRTQRERIRTGADVPRVRRALQSVFDLHSLWPSLVQSHDQFISETKFVRPSLRDMHLRQNEGDIWPEHEETIFGVQLYEKFPDDADRQALGQTVRIAVSRVIELHRESGTTSVDLVADFFHDHLFLLRSLRCWPSFEELFIFFSEHNELRLALQCLHHIVHSPAHTNQMHSKQGVVVEDVVYEGNDDRMKTVLVRSVELEGWSLACQVRFHQLMRWSLSRADLLQVSPSILFRLVSEYHQHLFRQVSINQAESILAEIASWDHLRLTLAEPTDMTPYHLRNVSDSIWNGVAIERAKYDAWKMANSEVDKATSKEILSLPYADWIASAAFQNELLMTLDLHILTCVIDRFIDIAIPRNISKNVHVTSLPSFSSSMSLKDDELVDSLTRRLWHHTSAPALAMFCTFVAVISNFSLRGYRSCLQSHLMVHHWNVLSEPAIAQPIIRLAMDVWLTKQLSRCDLPVTNMQVPSSMAPPEEPSPVLPAPAAFTSAHTVAASIESSPSTPAGVVAPLIGACPGCFHPYSSHGLSSREYRRGVLDHGARQLECGHIRCASCVEAQPTVRTEDGTSARTRCVECGSVVSKYRSKRLTPSQLPAAIMTPSRWPVDPATVTNDLNDTRLAAVNLQWVTPVSDSMPVIATGPKSSPSKPITATVTDESEVDEMLLTDAYELSFADRCTMWQKTIARRWRLPTEMEQRWCALQVHLNMQLTDSTGVSTRTIEALHRFLEQSSGGTKVAKKFRAHTVASVLLHWQDRLSSSPSKGDERIPPLLLKYKNTTVTSDGQATKELLHVLKKLHADTRFQLPDSVTNQPPPSADSSHPLLEPSGRPIHASILHAIISQLNVEPCLSDLGSAHYDLLISLALQTPESETSNVLTYLVPMMLRHPWMLRERTAVTGCTIEKRRHVRQSHQAIFHLLLGFYSSNAMLAETLSILEVMRLNNVESNMQTWNFLLISLNGALRKLDHHDHGAERTLQFVYRGLVHHARTHPSTAPMNSSPPSHVNHQPTSDTLALLLEASLLTRSSIPSVLKLWFDLTSIGTDGYSIVPDLEHFGWMLQFFSVHRHDGVVPCIEWIMKIEFNKPIVLKDWSASSMDELPLSQHPEFLRGFLQFLALNCLEPFNASTARSLLESWTSWTTEATAGTGSPNTNSKSDKVQLEQYKSALNKTRTLIAAILEGARIRSG